MQNESSRRLAVAWLAIMVIAAACYKYRPVALATLQAEQIPPGTTLLIEFRDTARKDVELQLTRVHLPFVDGKVTLIPAPGMREFKRARIDLRDARAIGIQEFDEVMSAVVPGALLGVAVLLTIILVLTKESCPLLFVDLGAGPVLVGEAYAGAAFRATQREDLLPVPDLAAPGRARLSLRNKAHETQYTDLARLVVVDHAPELRVLSTNTAMLLAAGELMPARQVIDDTGKDQRAALAHSDGVLWESDMEALLAREAAHLGEAPRSDGLRATFEAPPGEGPLVLEVHGGNTPLLDVTFGRFFAAMGDELQGFLDEGNDPNQRGPIDAWRAREGVDLGIDVRVEAQGQPAWQRVGSVPPIGPMALRRVAIELPARAPGQTIEVRLRGGTGFWRLDELSLSRRARAALKVHELPLAEARAAQGHDERPAFAEIDGRYHQLAQRSDAIELGFELPPREPGRARSTFFRSSGYYNVHPPFQGGYAPGNLLVAAREGGGLARFGLDLYRQYRELLQAPRVNTP